MIAARVLVTLAALWTADAGAHAELVGSTPSDGAKLTSAPSTIELRFNEPVTALSFRLFSSSGAPAALTAPKGAGEALRVALPSPLGEGHYVLSFRVVSLDSHPVGGSVAFTVGEGHATWPPAMDRDALRGWRATVRAVRDFGLLAAAGTALFILSVGPLAAVRALLGICAAIVVLAALAGTGLQGAAMVGPEADLWSADAWHAGLHSSFGLSACVAAAAAVLLAASALTAAPVRTALLTTGALAAIASFPMTGHAAGGRAGALAPVALAAHAAAAAFWVGSLLALFRLTVSAEAAALLRRFSRLGMVAVAILVAGGIGFAVLQLPSLADLAGSDYGRLILGKVALLVALLLLASLNRYRFLPALERGDPAAVSRLRRSIAGEIALIACVMVLTALLVQTAPPRGAAFHEVLEAGGRFAELSVSPARAGHNRLSVRFRDAQGQLFDPQEVLLSVENASAGVEAEARPMRREAPGYFVREGNELLFPGSWTIDVRARIGDFEQTNFRTDLRVR